jgi:flagellar FliJ protein
MRRFVFKLESVLEQRRHAERQRQRDVAQFQRQILQIDAQIKEVALAEQSSSVRLRGRLDPRTLAIHVRFSQVMRQKLSTLRSQLDGAKNDLNAAQAALVEASKQRKVLEKLEERRRASWITEQAKHETEAMDDLAQRLARGPNDSAENFPPYAP